MGTLKKIVGLGVVTGVVIFSYLRSMSGKANHTLPEAEKEKPQLV
jgi:hypothetical protein